MIITFHPWVRHNGILSCNESYDFFGWFLLEPCNMHYSGICNPFYFHCLKLHDDGSRQNCLPSRYHVGFEQTLFLVTHKNCKNTLKREFLSLDDKMTTSSIASDENFVKIIGSMCSVFCGDLNKLPLWRLQRWWSLATLGCTQAPKGMGLLKYNEGHHQLKSPNFVDNRPIFTFEISHPNKFFFTKLFCRLHGHLKNISWFSQRYYSSHFYGRM